MNEITVEAKPLHLCSYPCSICGSPKSHVVMRKEGIRIRRTFDIVACNDCGHVFVDPRVADEHLSLLYDEQYYRGEGFDRTIDYEGPASASKLSEVSAVFRSVASAAGSLAGLRWLDFGCGAGFLLEELARQGVDAVGFDDSPAALRRCTAKGLRVAALSEIEAAPGSFDVISAVEVIEHVADPRAFLRYLVSFLKIGGIAYIQTGNWNMVRRLPGTPYVMPEGHIHYFTPPELRRLFFEVGLDLAPAFNHSWFLWRDMPAAVRRLVPLKTYLAAAKAVNATAPGYGPFPIGFRVL